MKKEITHDEKLKFYKQYTNKEFQEELNKTYKVTRPLFIATITALPITAIVLGIFNPWMFLGLIPAFTLPFGFSALETYKRNKKIGELNKNFNDGVIYEMMETGEWQKLGYELSAKEMKNHHYVQDVPFFAEEKIVNRPRSLNVCIIKDEDTNDNNLVKKAEQRNKNQKHKIVPQSKEFFNFNEDSVKDVLFSYSLLNIFCNKFNCSLVEFSKSVNYDETKEYYIIMKDCKDRKYEFVCTKNYFVGINNYSETDLTAEWRAYLTEKQKRIEKGM